MQFIKTGGIRRGMLATTASIAVAATGASAFAQGTSAVEEIVVVAQKRGENLQKVPIAVSAVTADMAKKLGVTAGDTLPNLVPGLNFNRQSSAAIPFIRGIGTQIGQRGNEPSVAFYVDDVYMPAGAAALLNFNNIDRIEVLKGPQGTLFGRNATGGVIQVFTKDPSPERALDVSVGYANYDTYSSSIYLNGGITQKISANLSGYWSRQYKGWGRNVATGNETYLGFNFGGRLKVLMEPSDRTQVLFSVDYDTTVQNGPGNAFGPAPGTAAFNPLIPGGQPALPNPRDTNQNVDPEGIDNQAGGSLKITHEFDAFTVKSITAYRKDMSRTIFSYDPIPIPFADVWIRTQGETRTQELQFLSPQGAPLTWILGIFYFNDTSGFRPLTFQGAAFPPGQTFAYGTQNTRSWSGFGQATATILEDTHLTAGLRYTVDQRELVASYANSFGLIPNVCTGAPALPNQILSACNSPQSAKFPKLTGRLAIDRQFTPDFMGYVAYNRGFKSGLFNQVVNPGSPIETPAVQPEVLDAYTAGFKSQWLDNRLRLNAEAYFNSIKNLQAQFFRNASTALQNAGKANIYGIDIEITAVPIENLTITANFNIQEGKYASFPGGPVNIYCPINGGNFNLNALAGVDVGCPGSVPGNLRGNHTIQTPPFSSTLAANYVMPSSVGPFNFNVSWFHGGNYWADSDNGLGQGAPSSKSHVRQKILDLVNASVGWTSPNDMLGARVWIKNALDEQYWAFATQTLFNTQQDSAAPRTFGVTFDLHL